MIEEVAELLALLRRDLAVVLLTGRPVRTQRSTMAWLEQHGVRWDLLVMRHFGDHTAARDFKQSVLTELRAYGFDLRLAFEDDPRNAAMFRDEGVPCLYIHSGYYDFIGPEPAMVGEEELPPEEDSPSPSG